MISPEFKAVVHERNLLRTRIMIKDSFVIDPTFSMLNEMLSYAQNYLRDLIDPYDGEYLEDNPLMWTEKTMNKELVSLINNFSYIRINHLKRVVSKVLKTERSGQMQAQSKLKSKCKPLISTDVKKKKRQEALQKIIKSSRTIAKLSVNADNKGMWTGCIDDLDKCARELINAVSEYKANK